MRRFAEWLAVAAGIALAGGVAVLVAGLLSWLADRADGAGLWFIAAPLHWLAWLRWVLAALTIAGLLLAAIALPFAALRALVARRKS